MSQEKQIEKMAKIIKEADVEYAKARVKALVEHDLIEPPPPRSTYIATELYAAGFHERDEWISVDERLPERNGRYLAHCNIEGQSFICTLHYNKVLGFDSEIITHWQPLPEPPKMKGGAE